MFSSKVFSKLLDTDNDADLLAAGRGEVQVWTLHQVEEEEAGGRPVLGGDGDRDLVVTIFPDQEHHHQPVRGHLDPGSGPGHMSHGRSSRSSVITCDWGPWHLGTRHTLKLNFMDFMDSLKHWRQHTFLNEAVFDNHIVCSNFCLLGIWYDEWHHFVFRLKKHIPIH